MQQLRFRFAPIARTLALVLILAACQPIQAPDVAPDVDRVGFPTDYQTEYSLYYEFDRTDNKTRRLIYANQVAADVLPGQPFPYGSVLVMEVYRTAKDDAGNVILDENGAYTPEALSGIFVMRKEPGFGAKYGELRNGEWEYVAYREDGSFLTPPDRTNGCATCHMEAGQGKDWVFGAPRHQAMVEPPTLVEQPPDTVVVTDYSLVPPVITVTVGTTVTWTNEDVLLHTITANDLSFNSGALRINASFPHLFEEAGEYDYFCAIHPSMHGKVVVEP
jgi:plastocyanin